MHLRGFPQSGYKTNAWSDDVGTAFFDGTTAVRFKAPGLAPEDITELSKSKTRRSCPLPFRSLLSPLSTSALPTHAHASVEHLLAAGLEGQQQHGHRRGDIRRPHLCP